MTWNLLKKGKAVFSDKPFWSPSQIPRNIYRVPKLKKWDLLTLSTILWG